MFRLPTLLIAALHLLASAIPAQSELPRVDTNTTRIWIGPEYWTNPLMNWRLHQGRLECTHGGWNNELHSLTHQLRQGDGAAGMSVRLGRLHRPGVAGDQEIFAGFKLAALGHRNDYRSNILHDLTAGFAEELQQEQPVLAGITSEGRLLIGSNKSDVLLSPANLEDLELQLTVQHTKGTSQVKLQGTPREGPILTWQAELERDGLTGNIALACHPLRVPLRARHDDRDPDHPTFWFSHWSAEGDKLTDHPDQTYGPILWTQYTVNNRVLKLMAFLVPMEDSASHTVDLQVKNGSAWETIATSQIDPLSRTALFRIENWDDGRDRAYRVAYAWNSPEGETLATWGGTIRKNPADQKTISLAGLSCSNSELFPNRFLEKNLLAQEPDLVFFAGDQIYEPNGGYGIVVSKTEADLPRAALNYLGKFWYTGLSFRELIKDRPMVMIPDDHDVYSNDLWGKNGVPMPGNPLVNDQRCFGGYRMHPEWVKMVEHTQMGHHPDPFDPAPVEQGIAAYYTSLDLGGVSFALINDRKFKSAPGDILDRMEPLFARRGQRNYSKMDTINETDFDTRTLDDPKLTLLGERQLAFLKQWGQNDATLRAVLSQSAYCQPHHLMVADFDSNGWPQSGRRRALEVIRQAKAVMVHGDLHFATLVRQGIDDWEDAGWSFTLPAVSTAVHRAWRPQVDGMNRQPGMPDYTGRFLDGWKNKITVWAAANPHSFLIEDDYQGEGRATLDYMRNGGLGYGIVRFNTEEPSVTFESWPVYGTFHDTASHEQHPGFPKTIPIK